MQNPFDIVQDSSIWFDSRNYAAVNKYDGLIRIGIVKKAINDEETNEIRYLVEIQNHNDKIELNCIMMRRFGGVYNYEDYIFHGYKMDDKPDPVTFFDAKAGDIVIVAFLNGQGRQGVILGGISHPARKTEILTSDGPQYKSEINGLETFINKDGEMTVTFKGVPTNITKLDETPSKKIAPATYNTEIGSSYYKFDKTGGWIISDNAKSGGIQSIKLDKANGFINIAAGNISLKLEKKSELTTIVSKNINIKTQEKTEIASKQFNVSAETSAYIKSSKIAIGKEGAELLEQLGKLIDALSKVQAISPVGPCTPLISTPQWGAVEAVKAKIKEITGSF